MKFQKTTTRKNHVLAEGLLSARFNLDNEYVICIKQNHYLDKDSHMHRVNLSYDEALELYQRLQIDLFTDRKVRLSKQAKDLKRISHTYTQHHVKR